MNYSGGGGGTPDLIDGDDQKGENSTRNSKKSLGLPENPKKSLGQKLTPIKSHATFLSL